MLRRMTIAKLGEISSHIPFYSCHPAPFVFSLWNLYKVAKSSRRRGDDASSQDALIDDTPNLT